MFVIRPGATARRDRRVEQSLNRPVRAKRSRERRVQARFRPWIDALEVRALLSNIVTVKNTNDSGPGSLRDAISNATTGEIINFARSAFGTITLTSAPLVIATSVTIDGPGPKNVTINGNNSFQDLVIDANVTARVSGLTITEGEAPAVFPYVGGGLLNDGVLTVANCVITKNSALFDGGGIANDGSLTVSNSVVSNNTAGAGAGIYNASGATLELGSSTVANNQAGFVGGGLINLGAATITRSAVSDNSASAGGGIADFSSAGGGAVTISSSSVSNNSALSGGGGIFAVGGTLTIAASTLANNAAGNSGSQQSLGGAVNATENVTLNISGSVFAGNTAVAADSDDQGSAAGGAIYMSNFGATNVGPFGNLNISSSKFSQNAVVGAVGYGGAMYIDVGITVAVTGTSFTANTVTGESDEEGGAVRLNVFSDLEQSSFTGCNFQGNSAVVPATSSVPGTTATGGALANEGFGGSLLVSGCSFIANQAVGGPAGGFGIGGAILEQAGTTLTLSNSSLVNNQAIGGPGGDGGSGGVGGGLAVNFGVVTVDNTGFFGNQAIGGAASGAGNAAGLGLGGGILNFGTLDLSDSVLGGNEAKGGAGSDGATGGNGNGGGIENEGTLTVSNSTLVGNEAKGGAGGGNGEGGGISAGIFVAATTTLTDTLVTLNQADGGSGGGQGLGGGLFIASGTTTLTGKTKVVLNNASTSNNDIYGL
jgi:hypothetical protein